MTSDQMPPTGPDGFIRIGDDATSFLEEHLKTILLGAVVAVVLAIGWATVANMRESADIEAQNTLAEIAAIYPGNGKTVPDSVIQGAIERYQAFIAENPPGVALYMAQFNLGRAYEAAGDADAAIKAYQAAAQGPETIAAAADMRRAYVLLAGGDKKAAGEVFSQVISRYPGLAPQAATEMARMAELAGATDVAIDHYRQIMTHYGNSPQAAEAQARLSALGAEIPGMKSATSDTAATPESEAAPKGE